MKYDSLFMRLVANSEKPDDQNENGCWIWTGNVSDRGYGRVTVRNGAKMGKILSHRAMEQIHRNQAAQLGADLTAEGWLLGETVEARALDPDNETIEHLCACRRYINPDHWIVVTRSENTKLMHERLRR